MPIRAALRPLSLLRACAVAACLLLPAGAAVLAADAPAAAPLKVLRYAFRVAETGFDPAQISDL